MKKNYFAILMMGLAVSLAACSNDDEEITQAEQEQQEEQKQEASGEQQEDTRGVILPVSDVDESVTAFCNQMLGDGILGFVPGEAFADTCICLNSNEEMAAFFTAPWPLALPTIDFDKYTLVVGQRSDLWPYCRITSNQIREEQGKLVIYLIVTDYSNKSTATYDPSFLCFWGLYPKLEQKVTSISVLNTFG